MQGITKNHAFIDFSAGVGRTGTYIAVDIITHLMEGSKHNLLQMKLDVMGIVHNLRQDRGKMIQTKVIVCSIH